MVVIRWHGINPTKILGIFHLDKGSKNMLCKKDTHLETYDILRQNTHLCKINDQNITILHNYLNGFLHEFIHEEFYSYISFLYQQSLSHPPYSTKPCT